MDFIKNKIGFNKNQHGYQQYSNTETAVSDYVGLVMKELDKGKNVASIYFDFSKAFDTVDHCLMLSKLDKLGIRGVSLKLIETYLQCRQQYTMVNETKNDIGSITHGIPQGSVLGPLCHTLYVWDLQDVIMC